MGTFSIWHWVIILAVVLLLFGAGKIPRLMGDLAKGITAFKKGLKEELPGGDGDNPKPIEAAAKEKDAAST
jgi:sec-independent protein translocase protein TatA